MPVRFDKGRDFSRALQFPLDVGDSSGDDFFDFLMGGESDASSVPPVLAGSPVRPSKVCTMPSCRNTIPGNISFKTCVTCRAKSRDKQRRKKEQKEKLARAAVLAGLQAELDSNDSPNAEPGGKRRKHKASIGSSRPRKSQKTTHAVVSWKEWPDVSIGDKCAAYLRALRTTGGIQISAARWMEKPRMSLPDPPLRQQWTEFQTSTLLHSTLADAVKDYYQRCRSASEPRRITFCGYYSVVADPSVSLLDHLAHESKLVRKTAKLLHSPSGLVLSDSEAEQTYECRCAERRPELESKPETLPLVSGVSAATSAHSASSATTSKAPLKRQQSDLSKWIMHSGLKAKAQTSRTSTPSLPSTPVVNVPKVPRACGGTIYITVRDDMSHFLGSKCRGLQILVAVEHPPRH